MRQSKSIWIRYINIRFVKVLFYLLLGQINFFRDNLKIYLQTKKVSEVGFDAVEICNGDTQLFIFGKVDDVDILGKSGLAISNKFSAAIGGGTHTTSFNMIKPMLCKSKIKKDGLVFNMVGIHKGHRHFFHIFFDYFIPLFFYLKTINKGAKIEVLVRQDLNSIQEDLIKFFEDEFSEVKFSKIATNQIARCSRLAYFCHNHFSFYDNEKNLGIGKIIQEFRDMLIEKYNINKVEKNKVYISRLDAQTRKILNEDVLIDFLKKEGFEIHTLADKKFKQQIEIFANSKLIIAPHGAALTNLMFCDENAKFVEIFPKKFFNEGFVMIAKLVNLKRYEIIEDNESLKQCFYINLAHIKNKLRDFSLLN